LVEMFIVGRNTNTHYYFFTCNQAGLQYQIRSHCQNFADQDNPVAQA